MPPSTLVWSQFIFLKLSLENKPHLRAGMRHSFKDDTECWHLNDVLYENQLDEEAEESLKSDDTYKKEDEMWVKRKD